MKNLFILLSFFYLIAGCNSNDTNWLEDDKAVIETYLTENNIPISSTPEGVYYNIEEEGTGNFPVSSDNVEVHYEGFYLDGVKFDSSYDRGQTATFPLNGVIEGWRIGLQKFQEGSKGKLFLPSTLAYGSNPPAGIRANAIMIFYVHLIDIK